MPSELPWWSVVPRPLRRRAPKVLKRAAVLMAYFPAVTRHPIHGARYLLFGRELDNFTYEVGNLGELAVFIASVVGGTADEAAANIAELEGDVEFRLELELRLRSRYGPRAGISYGRRTGWYALIRRLMPRYVVETGVRDGLGSAVILRALERNADAGVDGRLASVDIDPEAGWLVPERLRTRWELAIADSVAFLNQLNGEAVDFFIHDSDHRYMHEWAEYAALGAHLSGEGVLLSDNSHALPTLFDYSAKKGRHFYFWHEKPTGHWYPGGGIGVSVLTVEHSAT